MGITHVCAATTTSRTRPQLLVLDALGRRAAALRAPAAAARNRRQAALEAPRRRLGPGAARRRLPAGGGPQLPRAARLGRRGRPDDLLDRRADPAVLDRARRPLAGGLRRAEAALDERPLHPRDATRRLRRRGRGAPRGEGHEDAAADTERLERACAIAQEKAQTLAEVWPLIAFLFEPPVDDPKAWRKVMGEGPRPGSRPRSM